MKIFGGHDGGERGAVSPFLIGMILFALLAVGAGAAFVWAYSQMGDYKNNSDQKVATAVADAKTEQQQEDQKQFAEDSKKPFLTFRSSSDLGNISFDYPRTWSQYLGQNNDQLAAYFYPVAVPAVDDKTAFALRVTEVNQSYADVVKSYEGKIKDKKLSATTLTIGKTDTFAGYEGTRIDGQFSDTITGSVAIFKIRDKTLRLFVDSADFMNDFNNTILPSLKFVP